jgi:hypothetical protein
MMRILFVVTLIVIARAARTASRQSVGTGHLATASVRAELSSSFLTRRR